MKISNLVKQLNNLFVLFSETFTALLLFLNQFLLSPVSSLPPPNFETKFNSIGKKGCGAPALFCWCFEGFSVAVAAQQYGYFVECIQSITGNLRKN